MISQTIQQAMNEQINAELYSSYLYLSMAAYFDSVNLNGMANWMRCQAQEEVSHAMKFFNFVSERGGTVVLKAIDAPPASWDSALNAFEDAYAHEQKVTAMINDLVSLSIDNKDYASNAFLQWFVTEQVEEEASADGVVQKLRLAGNQGNGLFMVDRELAQRTFSYPTSTESE